MTVIDAIRDLVRAARSGAAKLHAADQRIRVELEALEAEAAQLRSLPPPPAELEANIRRLVDALADAWRRAHGATLRASFSGRIDGEAIMPPAWPDDVSLRLMGLAPFSLAARCAFHADAIAAGCRAAIMAAPPVESGPPMAERPARLRAIAERGAALEREHAGLVEAAAEAGVMLPELPNNRAKRLQRERQEEQHRLNHVANAGMHRRQHTAEAERERAREAMARLEAANAAQAAEEAAARGRAAQPSAAPDA
jgi:hypothetical protein